MANPNFPTLEANTLNSLTNPLISQKISDNITGKIPLLYLMNKIGHKNTENGGLRYQFPIFKELNAAQAYTGDTVLNTVVKDKVSSAVLYRKLFTTDITLNGSDLLQNSGDDETAIVNYIVAQIEMSEEDMKATLAGSSLGLFSSQADGDLGITGLQTILPLSTTTGTYAGLDRATYSYWRHQTQTVTTGWNTNGLIYLRALQLGVTRGEEAPTVITATAAGYANLERSFIGTVQYNTPSPKTQFGELGFEHINYHGAVVIIDDGQPTNTMYMLNLKYLKLLVNSKRDMAIRDFITPTNQDIISGRMYWAGNLVCNNLARQGVLQGAIETY